MAEKIEKITRSLSVFRNFWEIFEEFDSRTMGGKGEKISAGLIAFMALYEIDENLANSLANPRLTVKQAAKMIQKNLKEVIYRQSLESLTPEQRARLLGEPKHAKGASPGKKK